MAEKDAFITALKELIEKLEGQVGHYRQAKFGPKSEKLDPAQLELALEDLETAIAETQAQIAAVEDKIAASATDPAKAPRAPRKARALPEHLPRALRIIEPQSIACPCGCGDMVRIGEDRTERLDYIPARYQVSVTDRPKYACPKGRTGVVEARAPPRRASFGHVFGPMAVMPSLHYHPGRKGEYADEILMGFDGTIQVDAYGGYSHLAKSDRKGGKPLKLAFCWAHGRRKLIAAKPKKGSPIVDEALLRIAALYKVEDSIRGSDPDQRREARQNLSRPLADGFFTWLAAQAARVSRKSDLGCAMAYMLKRQNGFRVSGLRGATGATVPFHPRRWKSRHGLEPGRKRDPQPGHEPPQRALCQSRRRWPELGPRCQSALHLQNERRRALCLPARPLHQAGQRSPRQEHRRPDAVDLRQTARRLAMSSSGTPRRPHAFMRQWKTDRPQR